MGQGVRRLAGANASAYGEYPLTQAHAVLWDPSIQRLWVTGQDPVSKARILTALVVGGTPAAPVLREDTGRRAVLPSAWGHDVYGHAHDPDLLWVSGDSQVWLYDKRTRTFSPPPGGADRTFVKSIGNQPSGQVVETRPDSAESSPGRCAVNTWCTDTVDFYGPDTSRTRAGAVFYKARVWSPYYSVVDRTLHSAVWDRARTASGTRVGDGRVGGGAARRDPARADAAAGQRHLGPRARHRRHVVHGHQGRHERRADDVAAAALPDGTLHLGTVPDIS
ncbi:hypothetical protein HCN51_05050 [Nonomuraea sp. FMUSA5-5]|uniref:Lipoprotein LpqB beta-propeller domain-containing protein n=1 Tax=Nonomuraea composti TaxID=2720023 RepID=A0ABX1AXU2_9ACTN|nr:hypothetical protein [Nonomuraea sp. FMUSA5-5]NJP88829.1 hypothetical protein [Nonomuraea sp. FMUSA5-5]